MGERSEERELLAGLSEDDIAELTFMHLRNMWAVDGLYFLGIEEEFGTEAATRIDANVWKVMGKIEARRLRKLLDIGESLDEMIRALKFSGWAMDLEDKVWEKKGNSHILMNTDCRVQNRRIEDEQGVFPCKVVRLGFLKAFAKEINEDIEVICHQCPPDEVQEGLWCKWEFRMKEEDG